MKKLDKLETAVLIDMLALRTAEYTRRLSNNEKGTEFIDCKESLSELQREIKNRNENPGDDHGDHNPMCA